MSERPATPECDKALAVRDRSNAISEFLEWLDARGVCLARYQGEHLYSVNGSRERLLAEHFGIDLDAMEREKRAILDTMKQEKHARLTRGGQQS